MLVRGHGVSGERMRLARALASKSTSRGEDYDSMG